MADANSVSPGLATLGAGGWTVTEPSAGGRFGSVGVLTPQQTLAIQALVSGAGRLRTFPVRVATFGDSTANLNTAFHDISVLSASGAAISPEKSQIQNLYPQAYFVGNGGISGQTTTQMLARDASATGANRKAIGDIIDLRPDVVLLRGGSINNISGATAGTVDALVATCYAEHCTIIQRFLAAGLPVIDSGIYGYAGSGTDPATVRSALMRLEALFDAYAAQYPGRVFRPSWTGVLRDGTGAFLPNVVLADGQGLHLSFYGQYLASQQEAAFIAQLFGASSGPRYRGPNLLRNAATAANGGNSLFASTSTGGLGTTPTGFTFGTAGAGGTRQNGKIETIDGRVWATMEFVPTATGGINIYMPLDAANWTTAAGDVWAPEFDFMFQPLSGSSIPVSGMIARWWFNTGAAVNIDAMQISQPFTWPLASAWMGRVLMQPTQFGASETAPELYIQISVADTTPIKIGVSAPRLVKMGTSSTWPPVAA